jgi:hypothetical protein
VVVNVSEDAEVAAEFNQVDETEGKAHKLNDALSRKGGGLNFKIMEQQFLNNCGDINNLSLRHL